MRDFSKYLLFSLMAILLIACKTEKKYDFILQAKDGNNLKVGTSISYLGIEVGNVSEISFANINNEDFVVASIQLNKKNILNESSYIAWSEYGALEIINSKNSTLLNPGDTILLKLNNKIKITAEENVITPISTKEISPKEKDLLSPEEQEKLDSLQKKINNLNNLIKEVNDQD
jgi:paraquat-inducible protein B